MTLRAVVIGAGFAGEGHTIALRAAGVDVVVLCGRTPEPARAMVMNPHPNYVAFYGTQGALHLSGGFWPGERIQHFDQAREAWKDISVTQEIVDALPQVEGNVQRDWNQLALEFVADIRGAGDAGYPTFRDGWIANEIIDIVPSGQSWASLLTTPAACG